MLQNVFCWARLVVVAAFLALPAVAMIGCEKKSEDKIKDGLRSVGEGLKEGTQEAGEKVGEAAEEAGEEIQDAADGDK